MAETRYINPYTDFGFKKLFGTELNKEKKKGRAEEKIAIARSLKASGVDIDLIAKSTGLSIDEIKKL